MQENTVHHTQQMRVSADARARTLASARTNIHLSIARSFSLRGYALLMNVGLRVRYAFARMLFFSTGRCARCVHVYLSIEFICTCFYLVCVYVALRRFLFIVRARCFSQRDTRACNAPRTMFAFFVYLARTRVRLLANLFIARARCFSPHAREVRCAYLTHYVRGRTACDFERGFSRRERCTRACCVGSRVA